MIVGQTVICAETGKPFVVAQIGVTFNYGTDREGKVYSLEGCAIRELRQLADRSRPFVCYISSDGRRATDWHGNTLGHVVSANPMCLNRVSFTHGRTINHYVIRDVNGALWWARGNPGIVCRMHPRKG